MNGKCSCGKELGTADVDKICSGCRLFTPVDNVKLNGPYGWICPVCGCGNAPWTSQCNCTNKDYLITYSNGKTC